MLLFPKFISCHKLLTCLLFVLAGGLGYLGYGYVGKVQPYIDYRLLSTSEQVQQDAKHKITADTTIVQTIVYKQCGDQEMLEIKPLDHYIGMSLAQFQAVYPDWTVDYFDSSQIRMTLTMDALCREHANGMYLGVKDGYVTVFYGRPGIKPVVKESTKIRVQQLVPSDIIELEQGIPIASKEELLRTLEGIQSQ